MGTTPRFTCEGACRRNARRLADSCKPATSSSSRRRRLSACASWSPRFPSSRWPSGPTRARSNNFQASSRGICPRLSATIEVRRHGARRHATVDVHPAARAERLFQSSAGSTRRFHHEAEPCLVHCDGSAVLRFGCERPIGDVDADQSQEGRRDEGVLRPGIAGVLQRPENGRVARGVRRAGERARGVDEGQGAAGRGPVEHRGPGA